MIKVLVIDDSVVFRKILHEALSRHPGINVVGSAVNGKDALRKIRSLRPQLAVMDVEMPELDGLQTLDEIKKRRLKIGVIMFSTLTSKGAQTTLDALAKGAFDFVPKPAGAGAFGESVKRIKQDLIPRIEAYGQSLSGSRRRMLKRPAPVKSRVRAGGTASKRPVTQMAASSPDSGARQNAVKRPGFGPAVVTMGISTGGPNALREVIPILPADFSLPVLMVQHMPPVFTAQLARRLDEQSKLRVVEAVDRQPVHGGTVYLAPGDYHMEVAKEGKDKIIRLSQTPPENSCRPAVDVLFRSVAEVYGGRAIGVIMTGMGQDGLMGTRLLKEKGAMIIAQDEESSVVWGMPRFVAEEGLAHRICSLKDITPAIIEMSGRHRGSAGSPVRRPVLSTGR